MTKVDTITSREGIANVFGGFYSKWCAGDKTEEELQNTLNHETGNDDEEKKQTANNKLKKGKTTIFNGKTKVSVSFLLKVDFVLDHLNLCSTSSDRNFSSEFCWTCLSRSLCIRCSFFCDSCDCARCRQQCPSYALCRVQGTTVMTDSFSRCYDLSLKPVSDCTSKHDRWSRNVDRIQIKCLVKRITHAFLQFTDSEERDKNIRSANMQTGKKNSEIEQLWMQRTDFMTLEAVISSAVTSTEAPNHMSQFWENCRTMPKNSTKTWRHTNCTKHHSWRPHSIARRNTYQSKWQIVIRTRENGSLKCHKYPKTSRKKSKTTQMIGCQKKKNSSRRLWPVELWGSNAGMRRKLLEVTKEKHSTQTSKKNRPMEEAEADKDSDSLMETFHCAYEREKTWSMSERRWRAAGRWDALLRSETWRPNKAEIWESRQGHVHMGAGKFENKHRKMAENTCYCNIDHSDKQRITLMSGPPRRKSVPKSKKICKLSEET